MSEPIYSLVRNPDGTMQIVQSDPMQETKAESCENCRFYRVSSWKVGGGNCCRRPPLRNAEGVSNWPWVGLSDEPRWCGEWEQRQPGISKIPEYGVPPCMKCHHLGRSPSSPWGVYCAKGYSHDQCGDFSCFKVGGLEGK